MKQTRQAVRAVKQSIFLDVFGAYSSQQGIFKNIFKIFDIAQYYINYATLLIMAIETCRISFPL
jgi:hypothetical protein